MKNSSVIVILTLWPTYSIIMSCTPALSLEVMKLHYNVCLLLLYVQRYLHVVQTYLYHVSIWLCAVVLNLYSDNVYYIM